MAVRAYVDDHFLTKTDTSIAKNTQVKGFMGYLLNINNSLLFNEKQTKTVHLTSKAYVDDKLKELDDYF